MQVGFYGKLPSHGDFLRRRVSDAFVDAWDAWLRECLSASRTTLGERWLNVYLTSPAWRFACAAGACGPSPVIGLVAPSVDQVGRYFPLTIVAELSPDVSVVSAVSSQHFFDAAERLVIETLATERVDFDRFDRGVGELGQELAAMSHPPNLILDQAATAVLTDTPQAWQMPLAESADMRTAFEQLLSRHLEAKYRPLVMFWSDGSAVIEPCCLLLKGLPAADLYPALLEGGWAAHRWRSVAARVSDATSPGSLLGEDLGPMSFRSAAVSHMGRVRGNNEDGFVDRPEAGLWAVADGMGGHSHGEVASRMVCDALTDLQPGGTFEEAIDAARIRVQEVNDHLVRTGARDPSRQCGSTVVLLLTRGSKSVILWAGDSRAYRWRDGTLEQLTSDHSLAVELAGTVPAESSVITRAVGIEGDLVLDVHRDVVRPADRFLLCSDGLTRAVPESTICAWMHAPTIHAAVEGLIQATLDAGAPDNVTVLIAEAHQ
jgi:type VI secretion system protein ImpM